MPVNYPDKRGNPHPTLGAASAANAAIEAADEAKKHTELLKNQNAALSEQARAQAKAQKRQNELAEEALELERERAAEEAEHRERMERIESDRLQSDKDHKRFQRDVMVLESATDEERFEFFVNVRGDEFPEFWNSISYLYLLDKFEESPDLGRKYGELYSTMEDRASNVARLLNEHRSLKSKTDSGTRVLGVFTLVFYLGVACFLTNCTINKALLGEKTENAYGKPEYAEAWGTGYFVVLLVLIVGGLWLFLKNSVSVRNLFQFSKSEGELRAFNETHGDTLKMQMDFEKFARENVEQRKDLILRALAEIRVKLSEEEKQSIAGRIRRLLKDRVKDYPRRCRPSEEYLNDTEKLARFFSEGWTKSDLLTLECGIAHKYSTSPELLKRLAETPGYSMEDHQKSSVRFVNIGYGAKVAEGFLKNAGYSAASDSE